MVFQREISDQLVDTFSSEISIFTPIYSDSDTKDCCKMQLFFTLNVQDYVSIPLEDEDVGAFRPRCDKLRLSRAR